MLRKKHKASAILTALLLIIFVASVLYILVLQQKVTVARTREVITQTQIMQYARGLEDYAVNKLVERQKQAVIDNQQSIPLSGFTMAGASYQAELIDQQSLFDINQLIDSNKQKAWVNLLRVLAPDVNAETSDAMGKELSTWLGPAEKAESANPYSTKNPAYQRGHQLMLLPNMLLLIEGMNSEIFTKLRPMITALPKSSKYNINTITIPVLTALVGDEAVTDILQQRQALGIVNQVKDINIAKVAPGQKRPKNDVSLEVFSEYYLLKAEINYRNTIRQWQSLLYVERKPPHNAEIIWHVLF